ncbi:MAG: YncE family protein, partial [Zetaproteobacteria bacterium]
AVSSVAPAGSPIPAKVGEASPIKYCLYILKENRTYDQVLGDLPQGNGDPSLCLFPEDITPNHHALAREFVLLDNFYVESEVSADGHEWSVGAYATDYVEKSWPLSYGHNARGKIPYPSEGKFAVAMPASGYLWDRAREAGVTYRSYGEFTENGRTPADPATTRVASLMGHIDPGFRAWDMDYPDVKRAERFISELRRFEAEGDMPRLQIMRLPNDHTYGTAAGKLTPRAMVADNDLAFGMVVEAVSKSKFWPQTAIFVVEDDAQNGSDHVDAHRTIAFVISPYARRAAVDSTMYSTCSMLRTMELILGLQPMTQFDAAARPMYGSFQAEPDLRPYTTKPVTVDRNERNTRLAWGSDLSEQMDFSKEDAADDLLLNEVIWRSVKGPDSPMPAPVRAAFVFQIDEDEDGDDDAGR